jgi:hypothetical protein
MGIMVDEGRSLMDPKYEKRVGLGVGVVYDEEEEEEVEVLVIEGAEDEKVGSRVCECVKDGDAEDVG